MAGKKLTVSKVRSGLYFLARILGDIQAASRGPEAVVKRLARRQVGKLTSRAVNKLFK